MSNTENSPRRDLGRPEDNPFIAFRRFADSQVSSLLNTVFTLPATIANYNNVHLAREECLFAKDKTQACEQLHKLEEELAELRHEERESFRAGDVQAVLRTSEELLKLDRQADDLRRNIIGESVNTNARECRTRKDERLIEQFANQKGQEWGWMWDWGFPRPFDYEGDSKDLRKRDKHRDLEEAEALLQLYSEMQRMVADFDGKTWVEQAPANTTTQTKAAEPCVWSWSRSWQWPPSKDVEQDTYAPRNLERDPQLQKAGIPWQDAYEDLLREERGERSKDIPDEPSYEYSHDHEDQHDEPPTPKIAQHESFSKGPAHDQAPSSQETGNMIEELIDFIGKDTPLYKEFLELRRQGRLGHAAREGAEMGVSGGSRSQLDAAEETEMDAYERLEAASEEHHSKALTVVPKKHEMKDDPPSSILSTLTTTERTIAPDGTVTIKTILKKHFANGKEQNTETVHVQHNQETISRPQLEQSSTQPRQRPTTSDASQRAQNGENKRPSWFWSS
ncbi:hypothetical protein ACN47E_008246 [Coniothyrium glycines]